MKFSMVSSRSCSHEKHCQPVGTSSLLIIVSFIICFADAQTLQYIPAQPVSLRQLYAQGIATITVTPNNATCGTDGIEKFCSLVDPRICLTCQASKPHIAHPPHYILDPNNSTYWQSTTWGELYPSPFIINITLSLRNKIHILQGDIIMRFRTSVPNAMILQKSNDGGSTWMTYQYFSRDCAGDFNMAEADSPLGLNALCLNPYRQIEGQKGIIKFDLMSKIRALVGNQAGFLYVELEKRGALWEFLTVTDLKLMLVKPATSDLMSGPELHYGLYSIDAELSCDCNLHGSYCEPSAATGQVLCNCLHNTEGQSCDQCQSGYQALSWQPGSYLPLPGGTANECRVCPQNSTELATGNFTELLLEDSTELPPENSRELPPENSTELPQENSTELPPENSTELPQENSTESAWVNSTDLPRVNSTELPSVNSTELLPENSTESPWVNSTELPSVNSTKFPFVNSTELLPENSTELPRVNSTELQRVNSTELPRVNSTELPRVNSTELPRVNSTELPRVNSTELPRVNSTELPRVNSTELPSVNSTKFPSVNSTELLLENSTELLPENSTELPRVNSTELPSVNSTKFPSVNSTELLPESFTELPQVNSTELYVPRVNSTELPPENFTEYIPLENSTELPRVINSTELPSVINSTELNTTESNSTESTESNSLESNSTMYNFTEFNSVESNFTESPTSSNTSSQPLASVRDTGPTLDPRPCIPDPCQGNGECILEYSAAGYRCSCHVGFAGYACEVNLNPCRSNPCDALKTKCISERYNHYRCVPWSEVNDTRPLVATTPVSPDTWLTGATIGIIIGTCIAIPLFCMWIVLVVWWTTWRKLHAEDNRKYNIKYTEEAENKYSNSKYKMGNAKSWLVPDGRSSMRTHKLRDRWIIDESQLELGKLIYSGEFSYICEGMYKSKERDVAVKVVVKLLRDEKDGDSLNELKNEFEVLMGMGRHPNVVWLQGMCSRVLEESTQTCLVNEYVARGDMLRILRRGRSRRRDQPPYSPTPVEELISFACDIAQGMRHITLLKYVHRSLCAKNVLITFNNKAKICDFGMAAEVPSPREHVHYAEHRNKHMKRWMAYEALLEDIYSVKSDVWSFGIVLWEIVTLGGMPYHNLKTSDLFSELKDHNRMEWPRHCSPDMYDLMLRCWHRRPESRPSFDLLCTELKKMKPVAKKHLNLKEYTYQMYVPLKLEEDFDTLDSSTFV